MQQCGVLFSYILHFASICCLHTLTMAEKARRMQELAQDNEQLKQKNKQLRQENEDLKRKLCTLMIENDVLDSGIAELDRALANFNHMVNGMKDQK